MILRRLKDETEQQYRDRVQRTTSAMGYVGGWVKNTKPADSRAFCPTGDGGGIKNDCSSSDGGGGSPSQTHADLPKSFPAGSEKFRDAVDSVAPNPKAIWDRSKGRAETPPAKAMTQAADEQETSGKTLTPEAEAAYKDLVDEIGRQYEALVAAGLKARAWRGEGEPYGDPPGSTKPNSDKMRAEVARTGEFSFYMTEKGFGTGSATPDHPMLRETKYKTADGEPMIANDLFRVVHDMVAHVRGGYSFSTNGEFNGMLTHASTLPESAWPALFAETFGQNAVYEKTGNYAAQNAYASKIGPEIIKSELAKRKSSRAADPAKDTDEPLGYQHLKVRPWLIGGGPESRSADCGRDEGGKFGSGNDCAKDGGGKESPKKLAESFPKEIKAGDSSLKKYVPFNAVSGTKNSDFAKPAGDESLKAAIAAAKGARFAERYGAPRELPQGSPVAIRIDVPTFKKSGAYAVTVHRATKGGFDPSPVGYDSVARLSGPVVFESKEDDAVLVAAGLSQKFPLATVKGSFSKDRSIPEDIDDWTPVGYDPQKAAYFYDKRTGDEVVGGTDSISVGNSVFVRKPTYAKKPRNAAKQYRSAGFWGLESRADDCGRDEGGRFGSGNDCAGDANIGSPAAAREKPSWMKGKVDASGTTSHGDWFLERNEDGMESPGHGDVTSHVVRLVDDKSRVKAFVYADVHGGDMYVNYAHVDDPYRGQGIYKSLLESLSENYRVTSDSEVATPVRKAYESLGARLSRDGRYVLERKKKDESRSADCGRDEGGRFGSGNDCASDEGGSGTATATSSGGRWSSNETLSWPETSRDSSPPPMGDGRYGSINVSSPKAVKSSLDAAGIDPTIAPMIAGGSPESDVFVRPAPDFSNEFPGSSVTPVMFAFERDFAGVESGLHGSSVIGVTASGEAVVYHSTINVADSIKADDAKRHAAAREFYRAMTSSVEAARKAGISRIVLNAAGNSSATKGSITSTPWRGYTIWPRMGFDAPLPASIRSKLPPDLSHAKSLLDLHATPEGTRWWRDNGEDLDVTFNLKDRSSPQSKIMDRFIKKFGESRREMPLGAGDEWMSPEDLVRLDEMWQEIWDDGELDEYEWAESRSADCGRDDGGRFGSGNDCASDGSSSDSKAGSRNAAPPIADGSTIHASESAAEETISQFDWSAAESVAPHNSPSHSAIHRYASGHHDANGYFRHGASEESLQEFADSIGSTPERMRLAAIATDAAVTAIADAANPSGEMLVSYRGLRNAGGPSHPRRAYVAAIRSLEVGDILKEDGLFSTSASLRAAAASFTSKSDGVIFRVRGRSGAPIGRLANWNNEHEVLYPHRTQFVVTAIARNVTVSLGDGNDWTGVTIIDIEEKR